MARKIEALVLRNICTEKDGIIRKGNIARLTGEEMEKYVRIGAVQRPEFVASDVEEIEETETPEIEGGDA